MILNTGSGGFPTRANFTRFYRNADGQEVQVEIQILLDGRLFDEAMSHLANKGRKRGKAKALGGVVSLTITER